MQPNGKQTKSDIFVDVGLKNNQEKLLENGYVLFSGLKFKTTSYNNDGVPFYLIVTVYLGSINLSQNQLANSPEDSQQDFA